MLTYFVLVGSNGDVRVNWNTVTKNGTTLKTGDIVSVSGKGRLKVVKETPMYNKSVLQDCISQCLLDDFIIIIFYYLFIYFLLQIGEINRTKKGKFAVELVLYL